MTISSDAWFELWADSTLQVPYVLLVLRDVASNPIQVVDPARNYEAVFSSNDYREVKDWLLEDEYSLVTGRCVRGES